MVIILLVDLVGMLFKLSPIDPELFFQEEEIYAAKVSDMTEAPSEEGFFFLPNGGKTFFLQKPFELCR
ncbi:MAG: hypothetical protein ACOH5I_06660 [Oligoflexus sp.]